MRKLRFHVIRRIFRPAELLTRPVFLRPCASGINANNTEYNILKCKVYSPVSFRETCQWLKFPLNGLRTQSRLSPVVGLLPLASIYSTLALPVLLYGIKTWTIKASDTRRITAAETK